MTANSFLLPEPMLTQVLSILEEYQDSHLAQGLLSANCVTELKLVDEVLQITLEFPYPCQTQHQAIIAALTEQCSALTGMKAVEIQCQTRIEQGVSQLPKIKQIIAVASGKGGVGKSTTTVSLALAAAQEGAKVGILDADVYGPSIPLMLGLTHFRPQSIDGKLMTAASAYNISAQSIGFMLKDAEAAVWRGPMAASALLQLLNDTDWPELDYLFIDMPPGTGDIQLTLSQKAQLTGAVVVTTPQDIALADAQKGITLFEKVHVPVLGIVENMSYHLCSACGHKEFPFGELGGARIAERYQVPLLGQLPLQLALRESMDQGMPLVVADAQGDIAQSYRQILRQMTANLAMSKAPSAVQIAIED